MDAGGTKSSGNGELGGASPALNVAIWNARNAMCQTLQMNVQNLIIGRLTIDATKGKIRSGFQDSLSTVPSGAAGVSQDAGWTAVQKILCRKGTFGEALFAARVIARDQRAFAQRVERARINVEHIG